MYFESGGLAREHAVLGYLFAQAPDNDFPDILDDFGRLQRDRLRVRDTDLRTPAGRRDNNLGLRARRADLQHGGVDWSRLPAASKTMTASPPSSAPAMVTCSRPGTPPGPY